MKWLPSPNWNERPDEKISVLVIHYTGMLTGDAALQRMCDKNSQVSAHYMVDVDGTVVQMVAEEKRAWHAGISHWRGINGMNDISIGIEIVNAGHEFGYVPFPQVQMEAVAKLSQGIIARYPDIVARNVVAHSDVAPDRKQDPGELFDWQWLAVQGIGVVISEKVPYDYECDVAKIAQQKLQRWGYKVAVTGEWDADARLVAIAFQRHFRQNNIAGEWDAECTFILDKLLKLA